MFLLVVQGRSSLIIINIFFTVKLQAANTQKRFFNQLPVLGDNIPEKAQNQDLKSYDKKDCRHDQRLNVSPTLSCQIKKQKSAGRYQTDQDTDGADDKKCLERFEHGIHSDHCRNLHYDKSGNAFDQPGLSCFFIGTHRHTGNA